VSASDLASGQRQASCLHLFASRRQSQSYLPVAPKLGGGKFLGTKLQTKVQERVQTQIMYARGHLLYTQPR
jgi:hypothetical protein